MKNKSLIFTIVLSIIIGQLTGRFITPLFNLSSPLLNLLVNLVLVLVFLIILSVIVSEIKSSKIKSVVLNDITNLYKVNKQETTKAALVLANAFSDDPLMKNLFRGKNKQQGILLSAKMFLKYYQKHGAVYANSKNLEGVIIISQGKESYMSFWKLINSGAIIPIFKLIFMIGFRGLFNIILLEPLENLRKEYSHENSFVYIQMLGVSKESQGKGIGKQLLAAVFEKSKQLKLPIYLETESESNVGFYHKLGFEVIEQINLPIINQNMWTMHKTKFEGV